MGLLTTYVCDCCGAMSPRLDLFASPASFALGGWAAEINGALLCTSCVSQIALAANGAVTALRGSASGTQLQE